MSQQEFLHAGIAPAAHMWLVTRLPPAAPSAFSASRLHARAPLPPRHLKRHWTTERLGLVTLGSTNTLSWLYTRVKPAAPPGSHEDGTAMKTRAPERATILDRKRKRLDDEDVDGPDPDEISVAPKLSAHSRPALKGLKPRNEQNKRRRILDHVAIPFTVNPGSFTPLPQQSSQVKSFHSAAPATEPQASPSANPESSEPVASRPRRNIKRPSYLAELRLEDYSEDELAGAATVISGKSRRLSKARSASPDFVDDGSSTASSEGAFSNTDDVSEAHSAASAEAWSDIEPNSRKTTKAKGKSSKAASNSTTAPTGLRPGLASKSARGPATRMKNITRRAAQGETKGLDVSRPPVHSIPAIFDDITSTAVAYGFRDVIKHFGGKPLRVATVCSGTEAPLLSMNMVQDSLTPKGLKFPMEHLFSAEIEPKKQAYIARNFHPPLIVKDITEFIPSAEPGDTSSPLEVLTAYGAKAAVPGDIDLIIGGTSCVDYSNLNKRKKGIDDGGESGSTFDALLQFSKRMRPRIVIMENVFGAPWDEMHTKYEGAGYICVGVRLDSKDFYLPQTRQRGYMVCFDRHHAGDINEDDLKQRFYTLIERFRRPASSPVSAFLHSDEVPSMRDQSLLDEPKREVPWEKCRVRHHQLRSEIQIGKCRPYTFWQESGTSIPPEHGWRDWITAQPERVKDSLDITTARKSTLASGYYDPRYKQRIVDLSQNVDMATDSSPWGVTGCITPSGMPFLTDLARPITAEEALGLQGIPLDKASFTIETAADKRDLAGNAMSTPVICAITLSALTVGHQILDLSKRPLPSPDSALSRAPAGGVISGKATMVAEVLDTGEIDVRTMITTAHKTARRCYCEGSSGRSKRPIQQCQSCGYTTCTSCGGNPEHVYAPAQLVTKDRADPEDFHKLVRCLPLRIKPPQAQRLQDLAPKAKSNTRAAYLALLEETTKETFGLQRPRRSSYWTVEYLSETSNSKLELMITNNRAQWRFIVAPPTTLPGNDPLVQMLERPVATATVAGSLFDLAWSWRCAEATDVPATIRAHQEETPTWLARLKIPGREDSRQPPSYSVKVDKKGNSWLSCDIDGTYHLLPRCGTSFESLYKREPRREGDLPMYLFHDPGPITLPEVDSFVFSTSAERQTRGDIRPLEAWLNASWKPWDNPTTKTTVRTYEWVTLPIASGCSPILTSVEFGETDIRNATLTAACGQHFSVLSMLAPVPVNGSSQLATFYNWVVEAMRRKLELNRWIAIPAPRDKFTSCDVCAPAKPFARWTLALDRVTVKRYEDRQMAADYEQATRRIPGVAHVGITPTTHKGVPSVTLGLSVNVNTLAHRAVARLPAKSTERGVQYHLRLADGSSNHSLSSLKPFALRETRDVRPYTGTLEMSIELTAKQRLSLAWMIQQEQGRSCALEESEDAAIPELNVRVQLRASTSVEIRGGILAESVGYGKTILSLALIHSQLQDRTDSQVVKDLRRRQTGRGEIIAITSVRQLDKLSLEQFRKAKVVIVSRNLLTTEGYIARLAAFTALPGPVSYQGRAFQDWLRGASLRMPEHVRILEDEGLPKLCRHAKARYAADMADETYSSEIPSRRTRGKDYVPAGRSKTTSDASKPAPVSLDTATIGTPLLEMFYFHRVIVDEFDHMDAAQKTATYNMQADIRWGLSATPPIADLWDIAQLGRVLGVNFNVLFAQQGIMKMKNAREYFRDMTDFEKFDAGLQMFSSTVYLRQREILQKFLDTFVSANVEKFEHISCKHHLVPVKNDVVHDTGYNELSMHLNTHDMQIRKGNRSKTTDRETRLDSAIIDAQTPEEALSRKAAFFPRDELASNGQGLSALKNIREREVEKLSTSLRHLVPAAKAIEKDVFAAWYSSKVGGDDIPDGEVALLVKEICKLPAKAPSESESFDSDDEAKALSKRHFTAKVDTNLDQLFTSYRSLRYVKNVQVVREASASASKRLCHHPGCKSSSPADTAVSIACGHVICKDCYRSLKVAVCPASGCSADMSKHHLFWKSKMSSQQSGTAAPYGAKIAAAVDILKRVRKLGEQAILFVQFVNQIEEVKTALGHYNIAAAFLEPGMTAAESDAVLADFKDPKSKDRKTVIVLNASGENSAGLNLQNTNHIIFLSPQLRDQQNAYDATMTQAIGRARRHKQEKEIHVYHLAALDTIDVDVLEHRMRRTDTLTEQGAPPLVQPKRTKALDMSTEPTRERTQLVRGKDGKFCLQPQSWLVGAGEQPNGGDDGEAETAKWKGKHRVRGYEDFSSLVKFSRVYTEDDGY